MAEPNYIIGQGQTLTLPVELSSGGGDKRYPYTFEEALARLSPQIDRTLERIDALPSAACPDDESVLSLTLHPAFLAKSYHPKQLLDELQLRQVGSRERRVTPSVDVPTRSGEKRADVPTSELFVAGARSALRALHPRALRGASSAAHDAFRRIESVDYPERGRLRVPPTAGSEIALEVVLHADGEDGAERRNDSAFRHWCEQFGDRISLEALRRVDGLGFADVRADAEALAEFARFSFIRVVRRKPRLGFRALSVRAASLDEVFSVALPIDGPVPERPRLAVFDGGLPPDHPFGAWARPKEVPGTGPAVRDHQEHGTQVTSAALFGPLEEARDPVPPIVPIDHYRVTDASIDDDFALSAVLERISSILEVEHYDAIGLSIGPDTAMIDDDIDEWTTTMDVLAEGGHLLVVCAAGNNGDLDAATGLHRVQPSADGVNVLGVGARDTLEEAWTRASYSATGPGRSPGLVKPDVVAFGGESYDPYFAAIAPNVAQATVGTSFAAPTVLRLAGGLHATFPTLSMTAVRALLVHTAEAGGNAQSDVGHGSVRHTLDALARCAENEATVVYEGVLTERRYMRCPLPVPADGFSGKVEISATLVVVSRVDPQDTVSYTRAGASVVFRPDTVTDPGVHDDGSPKPYPTRPFFSGSKVFETEQERREDAHKWDTVMKARASFRPTTLRKPVFDVEHLARSNGGYGRREANVPYVLIVSLRESGNADLHAAVLRAHPTLRALEPQIDLPAR